MTFEFEINPNGWELDSSLWDELRVTAQSAMAETFLGITRNNFGVWGVDRPEEWPALTPKYSKRVDRTYATLYSTGNWNSGFLFESIQWDGSNPDYGIVWSDCPYAATHQFGDMDRNIPARQFMPITADGELTPNSFSAVMDAAETAIAQKLA